jgi:hypothetical protein
LYGVAIYLLFGCSKALSSHGILDQSLFSVPIAFSTMRFLKTLVTFSSLFLVASAAPATQKDSVISSIATVSQAVQANRDAINRYHGGSLAAIPVGRKCYDCWYALREAQSKLTDTKFTPSESEEVVKQFTSLNQDSIDLLDMYREKVSYFIPHSDLY